MLGAEESRKRKADLETPMDVDIDIAEVAQEKLLNGTVLESFDRKLEREYGTDWKTSRRIHMVPLVFTTKNKIRKNNRKKGLDTGAKAEKEVYEALEKFNDQNRITNYFSSIENTCGGFIFHDQTFNGEEIDFVYLSIYGLVVVECKGKPNAQSAYKEAFDQLKRKIPKLVDFLRCGADIPVLKVVAFPLLCRSDVKITDETRCLFENDIKDLKSWFRKNVFLETNAMSFDKYVEIAKEFLRKYHLSGETFVNSREFKKRGISDIRDVLERKTKYYTKEQAQILKNDNFEDFWITGAAGTGKTFVLKDQVQKLAECCSDTYKESPMILVITYNIPVNRDIKWWVKQNTKMGGKLIRVQTFSALLEHIFVAIKGDPEQWSKRKKMEDEDKVLCILKENILKKYFTSKYTNTSKYRHILVDEAQDLPGDWLTLLKAMLTKRESDLWVFEDPFQAVRKNSARPDIGAFTKHHLTKVFRNTHHIFEEYKHCYEIVRKTVETKESPSNNELSKPVVDHDVYGLRPEYIAAESDDELKNLLVSTLKRLQSQCVAFLDVAVITSCTDEADRIRKYLQNEEIKAEDAEKCIKLRYSTRKPPDPPVTVDSYQRYKGVESKVLIFFLVNSWRPRDMDIYVGFSRSFCHLIVIGNSKTIKKIKADQGINTG